MARKESKERERKKEEEKLRGGGEAGEERELRLKKEKIRDLDVPVREGDAVKGGPVTSRCIPS